MTDTVSFQGLRSRGVASAVVAAALLGAAPASADISPVVLRIQASNSEGSGAWSALLLAGQFGPGGTYGWSLAAPVQIRGAGGVVIATLTEGSTFIIEDPLVSIGFSVQAGASDTVFQISSALLSFPAINPAVGRADGSISGTDLNGNGVSLAGSFNGNMLTTQYNGFVPGGTTFAELISGPLSSAVPFGSVSSTGIMPLAGFLPIAGSVSNISMQYNFTLSAGDLASGTAVFEVVPAPGAAGLIGVAGLVALRRRRR